MAPGVPRPREIARSEDPARDGRAAAVGPHDALWYDAGCLVQIARRHATLVLASPAAKRASHLAACRLVWTNYAAAFGAKPAVQTRFADALQDATRAFMALLESAERRLSSDPELHPAQPPGPTTTIITLEELRPIVLQIIRQRA